MPRKPVSAPVQATYDQDVDALTIHLVSKGKTARTMEIGPGLYIDLDDSGAILAIEVLQASDKYAREMLRNLPAPGPLMTLNEAAEMANLSPATIRKQIHNRRVAATKQGRDWFVSRSDLMSYMKSRSRQGQRHAKGAA